MHGVPKRAWRIGALTLVCLTALTGAAFAASGVAPRLRSPLHGKAFVAGHKITFTVYVPDPSVVLSGDVFLTVSDKKSVRGGELLTPKRCGFRCDFATMHRVGHTHLWTYSDPYHFTGNWQDAAGKYYWQAFIYPKNGIGRAYSSVGTLRVVG